MKKSRKCIARGCQQKFVPRNKDHKVCSEHCALLLTGRSRTLQYHQKLIEDRRRHKENDRSVQLKEAEKAFNAYIRARDKDCSCISCGAESSNYAVSDEINKTVWQAGHYKSVGGYPELRFSEDNVHKQCIYCNMYLSGNVVNYRIGLIKKIGIQRVELLEMKHPAIKLSLEEIISIKNSYKTKLKKMSK